MQHPLDSQGGLRAVVRVLEDHGVAKQQVGRRDTGSLVVREVPGLHCEDRTEGLGANDRLDAVHGPDPFVGKQLVGVVGVVAENLVRHLHLAARLFDGLAHLQDEQIGQLIGALPEEIRSASQNGRSLLHRKFVVRLVLLVGTRDHVLDCFIGCGGELSEYLTCCWIDSGVTGHSDLPASSLGYRCRPDGHAIALGSAPLSVARPSGQINAET